MHLDPLVQWGVFWVCLGLFLYLASLAARNVRIGRKKDRKHEHETETEKAK